VSRTLEIVACRRVALRATSQHSGRIPPGNPAGALLYG
jgi:hypothetical protein